MERLESGDELLRRMTEGLLDNAVREADITPRYVQRTLEALVSPYVEVTMCLTQLFVAWCNTKRSERKCFCVENISAWTGRCKEVYSRFGLQREGRNVFLIPPMASARTGRCYLPPNSTESAALEIVVLKEMPTES